jgi:hypothetical protein
MVFKQPFLMKHYHLFLLCIFLTGASLVACKKDSKTDVPSTADFYCLAKVDGQEVKIELLASNSVELSTSNGASIDPPFCNYSYGSSIGPFDVADGPSAGIDLNQFFIGDCADQAAQFNGLFSPGDYPVGNPLSFSKNVGISYSDEDGFFQSNIGPQSNALFSITESVESNDAFGLGQTVSGTFQCTVHDDFGRQKVLTEGVFKLHFRPTL